MQLELVVNPESFLLGAGVTMVPERFRAIDAKVHAVSRCGSIWKVEVGWGLGPGAVWKGKLIERYKEVVGEMGFELLRGRRIFQMAELPEEFEPWTTTSGW